MPSFLSREDFSLFFPRLATDTALTETVIALATAVTVRVLGMNEYARENEATVTAQVVVVAETSNNNGNRSGNCNEQPTPTRGSTRAARRSSRGRTRRRSGRVGTIGWRFSPKLTLIIAQRSSTLSYTWATKHNLAAFLYQRMLLDALYVPRENESGPRAEKNRIPRNY